MHFITDLIQFLQAFAPLDIAESWDNVGLLLGDAASPARKVMTCLTVTPETVAEAVTEQASLIVSHHPILFRGAKQLTSSTPEGRMLLTLIQAGIAVYSPHTAFDNCTDGINDILAKRIGLIDVVPLRPGESSPQCKIVVFVPEADLTRVSEAMFDAGAGRIGQYRDCSFRLAGIGTFFGSDTTNPSVGQKGRREEVSEYRLEVVCPEPSLKAVVSALRKAHSYEEPAFDVYPLHGLQSKGGAGRIGRLPVAMPFQELAEKVKCSLGIASLQIVGPVTQSVQKVAVACGAAGEFMRDAVSKNADVFLTGEIRFHDALSAQAQNLCMLLPGHYASERCGVEELAERLQHHFPALTIWPSRLERDPLAWI